MKSSLYKTVDTKAEFMALSGAGKLGRTFRTWPTLSAFIESGYVGHLTIRSRIRDSKHHVPDLMSKDVERTVTRLRKNGATDWELYFQEVPHLSGCRSKACCGCGRILQGELQTNGTTPGEQSPYLLYGTHPTQGLRQDLTENGIAVEGVVAVAALRLYGGELVHDELLELLHEYPRSVIEFTLFRAGLIVWEVRNY